MDVSILQVDPEYVKKVLDLYLNFQEDFPDELKQVLNNISNNNVDELEEISNMYSYTNISLLKMREYISVKLMFEKLSVINNNIVSLLDFVKTNESSVSDLVSESNEMVEMLNDEISNFEVCEGHDEEIFDSPNMLIYICGDEIIDRTLDARSGIEKDTMKSISNITKTLQYSSFDETRKNSTIHWVKDPETKKNFELFKTKVQRMGIRTSKVFYLRLLVSNLVKEFIMNNYCNSDLKNVFLILDFGDFKNEGIGEVEYYKCSVSRIKRYSNQIQDIIKMFSCNNKSELEKYKDSIRDIIIDSKDISKRIYEFSSSKINV